MKILKKFFLFLIFISIYFYKYFISPFLPHTCKFYPTCSTYFLDSLNNFGFFRGSIIGLKRLIKCNPINKNNGYDPVPINIKGEIKWLF